MKIVTVPVGAWVGRFWVFCLYFSHKPVLVSCRTKDSSRMHVTLQQKCLCLHFLIYAMYFNSRYLAHSVSLPGLLTPFPNLVTIKEKTLFYRQNLSPFLYSTDTINPLLLHLATSIAIVCFLKLFLYFRMYQKHLEKLKHDWWASSPKFLIQRFGVRLENLLLLLLLILT